MNRWLFMCCQAFRSANAAGQQHQKGGVVTLLALGLLGTIGPPMPAYAMEETLALEEVVVTARRREENLQTVPVAVSVLTGEDLLEQGGLKIDTIGQMVPNVHFEAAGGTSGVKSPVVFIRGMGQNDFIPVEDPAVGIYLDGVYMGRNIGSVFDLIDIDRIEVLRGPQGTLFGRNTIGGAVNIISKNPGDTLAGSAQVAFGQDGYLETRATVNLPMGEQTAGRLSAFKRERDGYVDALQYNSLELGSDDIWGARLAFDQMCLIHSPLIFQPITPSQMKRQVRFHPSVVSVVSTAKPSGWGFLRSLLRTSTTQYIAAMALLVVLLKARLQIQPVMAPCGMPTILIRPIRFLSTMTATKSCRNKA